MNRPHRPHHQDDFSDLPSGASSHRSTPPPRPSQPAAHRPPRESSERPRQPSSQSPSPSRPTSDRPNVSRETSRRPTERSIEARPPRNHTPQRGGGSRNFFGGGKPIVQNIRPGDAFIFEDSFRPKKSFPFATPQQALKKYLGAHEDRAKHLEKETLRVIPFGGVEQVGLNCMGFEYQDEMIIIDLGLQFADQYQYGINCSIPDFTYCRGKKIVGACITHGHIDHIGATFYAMEQLGRSVPLYATAMAYELINLKQTELKAPLSRLSEYKRGVPVQLGKYFQVTPFTVDHSIPDSVGLLIETPVGRFVHTGDWKFDKNPLPNRPSTNYEYLESLGKRGIRALFSDSTNAHLMGSSISESEVIHSMEEIFEKAPARVITATFSSIIDRVMLIISTAEKYGRKVVLMGRSMNNYVDIAIKLGYVRPQPGTLISMEEANRLPDDRVTICCTGAQGERYAALMRIVTGESKDTSLKTTDTIIFSSSVIPGNERAVQGLFDLIAQQGAKVHHYRESEIHAGGHAKAEDTEKMITLLQPEYYVPIYGFPHMLYGNAKNAYRLGYDQDHVVLLKNGNILEFTKTGMRKTNEFVSHKLVTVDGTLVNYTGEKELHDRYQISTQGVLVIGITKKSGGFTIRYQTVGLPAVEQIPSLEKALDSSIREILLKIDTFKDLDSFTTFVERKTLDMTLMTINKEPKVVVVVQ